MNSDLSTSIQEQEFNYQSAVIFGAGPVGLWSAIKMLENDFAKNVVIIEKRFKFNQKLDDWASREMVVQFHRSILSIPTNNKPLDNCPYGVIKENTEHHRKKYTDLDHMSLRNIQTILKDHLLKNYPRHFLLLEMQQTMLKEKIPIVKIGLGHNGIMLFDGQFKPEFVLDTTGYHSAFMHEMLGVTFEGNIEYGSALKITWPEHELYPMKKQIEFHDCHKDSPFYAKGYSSVAEFSAPIVGTKTFFSECGYGSQKSEGYIPFLENDISPFSVKLAPFIRKILQSVNNHYTYDQALALFKTIREGKLNGINGFDFVSRLKAFKWIEADRLALIVRQIVNQNVTLEKPFINLIEDKYQLKKINIVFVPSRLERWLSINKKNANIIFNLLNYSGEHLELYCKVTACAAGDSLASTDFRHGLGINRGIHTATRLFRDKIHPEIVRQELIQNGYFKLNDIHNDDEIFNRAVFCRDWLVQNTMIGDLSTQ